jgi:hypothetical protein
MYVPPYVQCILVRVLGGGTIRNVESMVLRTRRRNPSVPNPWRLYEGDIMRKLLIAAAFTLFATPGLAGEPAKLSLAQMDKVTAAGDVCVVCTNVAKIWQSNFAKNSAFFNQTNAAAVSQEIN